MALTVAIKGDTENFAKDLLRAQKMVATNVNRKAARRTRRYIQNAIKGAGFGKRKNPLTGGALMDLMAFKDTPVRGYDFVNMSVAYSRMNPKYSRGKNRVDLLAALQADQTIEAQGDKWLVIPTKDTPLGSRDFLMPRGRIGSGSRRSQRHASRQFSASVGGSLFAFVEFRKGTLAGIVGQSGPMKNKVVWWLVKRVHIRARLPNFTALHERSAGMMQADFNKMLAVETAKLTRKYSA